MRKFKVKKENKGYAILFTVVVVGIISVITIGLANAAYKQMVLSSVAKDSTSAFYQADIASECAMYADNSDFLTDSNPEKTFTCATKVLKYDHVPGTELYQLSPSTPSSLSKCFYANITRKDNESSITTKIEALGYNICNKANLRTVERSIEVNY